MCRCDFKAWNERAVSILFDAVHLRSHYLVFLLLIVLHLLLNLLLVRYDELILLMERGREGTDSVTVRGHVVFLLLVQYGRTCRVAHQAWPDLDSTSVTIASGCRSDSSRVRDGSTTSDDNLVRLLALHMLTLNVMRRIEMLVAGCLASLPQLLLYIRGAV